MLNPLFFSFLLHMMLVVFAWWNIHATQMCVAPHTVRLTEWVLEKSVKKTVPRNRKKSDTLPTHRSLEARAESKNQPKSPDNSTSPSQTLASGNQSQSLSQQQNTILTRIEKKIESLLEYPLELRRKQIQGTVRIRLSMDGTGNLVSYKLIESSGSQKLDQLALDAIQRAAPFPPITGDDVSLLNKKGRLILNLPIQFRITP